MNWDTFVSVGIVVSALLIGTGQILFWRTLGEVNDKSPADQKISTRARMRFGVVLRRHGKFFPQSKKRRLLWSFEIAGFPLCALTVLVFTHYLGSGR